MVCHRGRCIPEYHNGIADELVKGPSPFQNHIGHGPQQLIQQGDHFLRAVLLGKAGEPADIRKQNRNHATFATQLCLLGVVDQFIDDGLCDIAGKHGADLAGVALLKGIIPGGYRDEDQDYIVQGAGQVNPQAGMVKQQIAGTKHRQEGSKGHQGAPYQPQAAQQQTQQQTAACQKQQILGLGGLTDESLFEDRGRYAGTLFYSGVGG